MVGTETSDYGSDDVSQRPAARRQRRPSRFEFVLTIGTLFVLTRTPVLFFRRRLGFLFGGPVDQIWQDDAIIRSVFLTVEIAALVLAVRHLRLRPLVRQWPLGALLVFVITSMSWSVEPNTTQLRALGFVGAAVVGWYLAERFSLREQLIIIALAGGLGAVASVTAAIAWPDLARSTNGVIESWSGVFVNRNLLGAAMATGLLALVCLAPSIPKRWRAPALALALLEAFLFVQSGSRTGLVALGGAGASAVLVWGLHPLRARGWGPVRGAAAWGTVMAGATYGVHRAWGTIVEALGRDTSLTRRTVMWALDRFYIAEHPVRGWGFEAIWTHEPVVQSVQIAFQAYPYQAHNGYYELLLGVGRVGFALFLVFVAIAMWQAFRAAWQGAGIVTFWPMIAIVFVSLSNFSESFLVAHEVSWALMVSASVNAARLSGEARRSEFEFQHPNGRPSIS